VFATRVLEALADIQATIREATSFKDLDIALQRIDELGSEAMAEEMGLTSFLADEFNDVASNFVVMFP
jgi:hypothetical protein